jgi:hypothetical protein
VYRALAHAYTSGVEDTADYVRILATGQPESLARFVRMLGRRKGLRISRTEASAILYVDADRVEAVGPGIEAASVVSGVELRLSDLDAVIESLGLNARPSSIWAAIGSGADERLVERERGLEPTRPLLGHVRVEEAEGRGVVRDDRPSFHDVAPVMPPDMNPRKFDDAGWHVESTVDAGQPSEYAWTHIALYLTWLIRHDLIEPGFLLPAQVAAVKSGAVVGGEGVGSVDRKLVSSMMTDQAASFSRDRYDAYLAVYDQTFADLPDYSFPSDANAYGRIEPMIDGLWSDWVFSRGADVGASPRAELAVEDARGARGGGDQGREEPEDQRADAGDRQADTE